MSYFKSNDIPRIQKYLFNQLDETERRDFELEMENNPNLVEELNWFKSLFSAVEETEDRRLKNLLQEKYNETHPKKRIKSPVLRRWSVAAGFLLIVLSAFLIWSVIPKGEQINESKTFFEPYTLVSSDISRDLIKVRSNETVQESDSEGIRNLSIEEAEKLDRLYETQNYEDALSILEKMPPSAAILFYKGNCLLALNRNQEALSSFKEVEKYKGESFSNFAQWYLAIAYFRMGDERLAKEYAEKTINNPGILDRDKEKAQQLLQELAARQ